MNFVILPEWTTESILWHVSFVLLIIGFGAGERYGLLTINYSKFRKSSGISSRTGMFILYFVPIVIHDLVSYLYLDKISLVQGFIIAAINLHFLKRCLETLFLHKYSGPINISSVAQIASAYSLAGGLLAYYNQYPIAQTDMLCALGIALFFFGQYFNYYHHRILAELRKGDKKYHIPEQGLFKYIAAPHYFMEILAWLGIALMSRHLIAYMIFAWTSSYLVARALKTKEWYLNQFSEYPKSRKAIIPGLL